MPQRKPPKRAWLPWLSRCERIELQNRLLDTALTEVKKRHWGALASGRGTYKQPRFLVTDQRAVATISGAVRYVLSKSKTTLFYRGQEQLWRLVPSVYRYCSTRTEIKKASEWLDGVLDELKLHFDPQDPFNDPALREALAQHYGLPTRWLDVVDHFQTAAWFAASSDKPDRDTGQHDDSVGYVSLLAVPSDGTWARAIDLRVKPSTWLRPHVQQAFAISREQPEKELGLLECLEVATFIVPRRTLRLWSNVDAWDQTIMFPNKHQDRGLLLWERAEQILKSKKYAMRPPQWPVSP